MRIRIRPETPEDRPAVRALTRAAFHDASYGWANAADALDRLHQSGELALSLVALNMDEAIIGHVAFSPVSIAEGAADGSVDGSGGWYDLGPLSVMATRQRTGIGGSLVVHGIAEMRAAGARGIVVLGDPAYYARFGFQPAPELTFQGVPADWLLALSFEGDPPSGAVGLSPAFFASA